MVIRLEACDIINIFKNLKLDVQYLVKDSEKFFQITKGPATVKATLFSSQGNLGLKFKLDETKVPLVGNSLGNLIWTQIEKAATTFPALECDLKDQIGYVYLTRTYLESISSWGRITNIHQGEDYIQLEIST